MGGNDLGKKNHFFVIHSNKEKIKVLRIYKSPREEAREVCGWP
jgi:hypothetical protein